MYHTTSKLFPISISHLVKDDKFFISRNGYPSINLHTVQTVSNGFIYALSFKNTLRVFKSEILVFPHVLKALKNV